MPDHTDGQQQMCDNPYPENYLCAPPEKYDLQDWFDSQLPQPTVAPQFVELLLESQQQKPDTINSKRLIWLGHKPELVEKKGKKNKSITKFKLIVNSKEGQFSSKIDKKTGQWLCKMLENRKYLHQIEATLPQLPDIEDAVAIAHSYVKSYL